MKKLVFAICLCANSIVWGQSFNTLATDISGDDFPSNMDVTEFATALSPNQDSIYFRITHANQRSGDFGYMLALDTNSTPSDGKSIYQGNLYNGSPNNAMNYDLLVLVYENSFFPGVILEVLDENGMNTSITFDIDTSSDYSLTMKFALADIGGDEAMNIIAGVGSFDISGSGPSDIIPNTNYIELVNGTTLAVDEYARSVSFYPNPAKDFIRISEPGEVRIFDSKGKLWYVNNIEAGFKIPLNDWSSGTYIIKTDAGYGRLVVE